MKQNSTTLAVIANQSVQFTAAFNKTVLEIASIFTRPRMVQCIHATSLFNLHEYEIYPLQWSKRFILL